MDFDYELMWKHDINLSFCCVVDHFLVDNKNGCDVFFLIANKSAVLLNETKLRVDTMEPVLVTWDLYL
jgi:hypothetical protein